MYIDFDGHHSGGSSFVYVNDFCYYRNCLYTHKYKFSSEKKKKTCKESQYIVSRPEPCSDPTFGSDLESGCDRTSKGVVLFFMFSHAAFQTPMHNQGERGNLIIGHYYMPSSRTINLVWER